MKSIFTVGVALLCFTVGLIGIVVPVLPGIPFLLIGLACCASLSPALRTQLHRQPRVSRFLHRLDAASQLRLADRARLALWAGLEAINPKRI